MAKKRRNKKIVLSRKGALIIGFLFLLLLIGAFSLGRRGFFTLYNVQREKALLQAENEALREQKKMLEEKMEKIESPEYLEKIAREKYGMGKEDEKIFFVIPEKEKK